ncbi:hypothetical protein BLOT_008177 [Blomia tropicalis]|nr:hypothetical protein BLOT_008177 [Blomia tropicalis]
MDFECVNSSTKCKQPYAYIVEQPAKCGVRFRYECEGRISSAIPGSSATNSCYSFPTIAVANHSGPVKVIVSCVTKNAPYRPHPHNLIGKKYCDRGISVTIFSEPICQFTNLGILCAKRKDVKERLRMREQLRIDPFGTGFNHRSHTFKLIDLNVIRLCFQCYLPNPVDGEFTIALDPIVSDEIYDKKAMSELSIIRLSHYSATTTGGEQVIMLCDRVLKDDIQIRFFRNCPRSGQLIWERYAQFGPNDIHKHFAITFVVPAYDMVMSADEYQVTVNVQLRRPSDGCLSEPITFDYFNMVPYGDSSGDGEQQINLQNNNMTNFVYGEPMMNDTNVGWNHSKIESTIKCEQFDEYGCKQLNHPIIEFQSTPINQFINTFHPNNSMLVDISQSVTHNK